MTAVLIVLIVVVGGVVALSFGRAGRRLMAKLGNIELIVEDVNGAVNHRPAGAPTLYQHAEAAAARVANLETKVEGYVQDDRAAHEEMKERLSGIETRLPDPEA